MLPLKPGSPNHPLRPPPHPPITYPTGHGLLGTYAQQEVRDCSLSKTSMELLPEIYLLSSTSCSPTPWKNRLSPKWSLVPKGWGLLL